MKKSIILAILYVTCVLLLLAVSIMLISTVKSIPDLFALIEFNLLMFYLISRGFYSIITDEYDKELRQGKWKNITR